MIRQIRRFFAVRRYFWGLSQVLCRRFGKKEHYSVEQVSKAAQQARFSMAFIAYAHAMFCSRKDFDAYYGPLHVACTYDGLRFTIAERFLEGATGFTAVNIIRRATPPQNEEYERGFAG